MPAAGAPIVTLNDVGKTFANGTQAIDRLDLEVRAGRIPDPARPLGLRQIDRAAADRVALSEPTRGTVAWPEDGDAGGTRGDIGFVFQEPTLMPWATVADNVALPLKLQGVDAAATAAAGATRRWSGSALPALKRPIRANSPAA